MDPVELKLKVTPETKRLLDTLGRHGLFGTTTEDAAERLLCERLRAIVEEGWVGAVGYPGDHTQPLVRPARG